jgi:hypothetical protein
VLGKHYELVDEIRQAFPNIDLSLLVKTLAIERMWPNERLRFYLIITYKNGIDMDMKDKRIYSLLTNYHDTTLMLIRNASARVRNVW